MNALKRITFLLAVLSPASGLLASGADIRNDQGRQVRVAVVVDVTPEGEKVAHPTPSSPVYYVPVTVGYQESGDFLRFYQSPPPLPAEVQALLVKALADQGYLVASKQSPPSLVVVFRWGYVAPRVVNGVTVNRAQMLTYLLGENWPQIMSSSKPAARELQAELADPQDVVITGGGRGSPIIKTALGVGTNPTSRYFLIASALDLKAYLNHQSVLLWRAHVSVRYWGHSLEEILPTLIAAGVPLFGRETREPQLSTAPVVPMGSVVIGTPVMATDRHGLLTALQVARELRITADTDEKLQQFAERSEEGGMAPIDHQTTPPPPTAAADRGGAPTERPRDESSSRIVRLPPFIVSEAKASTRWHYLAVPGFEILSRCSQAETEQFAGRIIQQQNWMDEIVSPDLQARHSVPTALILLPSDAQEEMSASIAALAKDASERRGATPAGYGVSAQEAPSSDLIPQIKLSDDDSVGVDIILHYQGAKGFSDLVFDPDYVFSVLARRAPSLPGWFVAGVVMLHRDRVLAAATSVNQPGGTLFALPRYGADQGTVLNFPPVSEVSAETPLLPLSALFVDQLPPSETDANLKRRYLWAAQSMLFVRWALGDESYQRRKALWRFARRASVEPVTEELFRNCFGIGYETALTQLSDYLQTAAVRPFPFVPQSPFNVPWMEARDSTEAEESRILGDWQRKEIEFVRPSHPEYAGQYAKQAGLTLMRAYDDGERDPALQAALGLYECSVGDDAKATGFLEAAVAARFERPRPYVELARIRLNAALAGPLGQRNRLDRSQVDRVLTLIDASRLGQPPQLTGYLIAANALEHADFSLDARELRLVEDGLRFFPSDPRLIVAAAQLDANAGYGASAVRVLQDGLRRVSDPRPRKLILDLLARYTGQGGR